MKPFCPSGWSIVSHTDVAWDFDMSRVGLYLSARQSEGVTIGGHELHIELQKHTVLDATKLDCLLEKPHTIPLAWAKDPADRVRFIFFWGTIYADEDGDLRVRCLGFDQRTYLWRHRSCGLDAWWHVLYPAAVLL